MLIQIVTAFFEALFTTRALLFVLGLAIGGVLTVSWDTYAEWMVLLTELWQMVAGVVLGK